jgi:hypothetical protein
MAAHLDRRAVAVVIHDAHDMPTEVGSGTCIEIGGRHFIATAAHLLDKVSMLRDVGVMALGVLGQVSNATPKVVASGRRGGRDGDHVDVAWLEIKPRAIPSWVETWGRVFVTLDRIGVQPVPPGAHAYVYGQPADYVRLEPVREATFLGLKALPFLTHTIAPPEPHEPDALYFDYPAQMHSAEGVKGMPKAPGLSGSGMWVVNPRADGVWTPDLAQLAAVQGSWLPFEWLCGTPMREWLALVRDDIGELAVEIDRAPARAI